VPLCSSLPIQPSLTVAQFPITALREIKLLKLLSHKNILRLEDMAVEHPSRAGKSISSAGVGTGTHC
jgi:hypothetical protein